MGWAVLGCGLIWLCIPATVQGQQQTPQIVSSPLEQTYINSQSPLNPFGREFSTPEQFQIVGSELELVFPALRPEQPVEPPLVQPLVPLQPPAPLGPFSGASALPPPSYGAAPYNNSVFQGSIQGPALTPGQTGALPNLFAPSPGR
jgi:hypothetical protein